MKIRQWIRCVAAVALLATTGCATSNPRHFEHVVADAESGGKAYSDSDWKKADAEYEAFLEKYGDMETLKQLSSEERQKVGRLAARYIKVRMQYTTLQLQDALQMSADLSRGFLNELNIQNPDSSDMMLELDALLDGLNSLFGGQ